MPHVTNSACLCFFISVSVWFSNSKTGLSTFLHGCSIWQACESCPVVCQPFCVLQVASLGEGNTSQKFLLRPMDSSIEI
jgi:hypothetical protein